MTKIIIINHDKFNQVEEAMELNPILETKVRLTAQHYNISVVKAIALFIDNAAPTVPGIDPLNDKGLADYD